MTEHNKRFCMAQRFLPEIKNGDKRILMVDGEPIPFTLARVPSQGETRGNLAAGGSGIIRELTKNDKRFAKKLVRFYENVGFFLWAWMLLVTILLKLMSPAQHVYER